MNNLALSESTQVDTIVYTLEGYDPEGEDVTFGLIGSDNFDVNPKTGEVKIVKALDREVFMFYIFKIFHTLQTSHFSQIQTDIKFFMHTIFHWGCELLTYITHLQEFYANNILKKK